MNINLYFTFCILIVFFASCIDNKTNNKLAKDDLYDISLDASSSGDALFDKKLLLSDIADTIIYVPLQLTDSTIIGKVSELFLTEDRIFVFDRNLAKSLFAYSRKGDILFHKSRGIGGPHEIYDLQDVSIDRINQILAIYSAGYNKVFLYDYNGKLQKEIKFLEGFSDVEIIDASHYLCYREFQPEENNPKDSYSNYRLCYLDGDGKLLKGWYKNVRNKNIQLPTTSNFFAKRFSNTILFEGNNKDSIFSFSSRQEEVLPFMTSNLKSSKILLTSKSYNEYNKLSANIAYFFDVPIESENFIWGSYAYKTIVYSYLYNKGTKKTKSYLKFYNDINGISLSQNNYDSFKGELVTLVDIPYYKNDISASKYNKIPIRDKNFKSDFIELIAEKDEGAVILGIIKLKE